MYDKDKVERIKTLQSEIDERVAELNTLLGGPPAKRTWSRRPKQEEAPA